MSKSDDLIDKLSRNLKAVKVKSLRYLAIQYFMTLLVFGIFSLRLVGWSDDLAFRMTRFDFVFSLVLFGGVVSAGCVLLAQYSRPGTAPSRLSRMAFWSGLALASIVQVVRFASESGSASWGASTDQGWSCSVAAVVMGAVASYILLVEIRREAPVKIARTARFLLLSSSAMAAVVLQIHCPNENPIHEILWHIFLPLGVFALSTRFLSRPALRW